MTFPALEETYWYQLMPAGTSHDSIVANWGTAARGRVLDPLTGTALFGSFHPRGVMPDPPRSG